MTSVALTPDYGVINLDAELAIAINSPYDEFGLALDYCLGDTDCPGYVNSFPVNIHTSLGMAVVDGVLDATLGEMEYSYGLEPSTDLHLDCDPAPGGRARLPRDLDLRLYLRPRHRQRGRLAQRADRGPGDHHRGRLLPGELLRWFRS